MAEKCFVGEKRSEHGDWGDIGIFPLCWIGFLSVHEIAIIILQLDHLFFSIK